MLLRRHVSRCPPAAIPIRNPVVASVHILKPHRRIRLVIYGLASDRIPCEPFGPGTMSLDVCRFPVYGVSFDSHKKKKALTNQGLLNKEVMFFENQASYFGPPLSLLYQEFPTTPSLALRIATVTSSRATSNRKLASLRRPSSLMGSSLSRFSTVSSIRSIACW